MADNEKRYQEQEECVSLQRCLSCGRRIAIDDASRYGRCLDCRDIGDAEEEPYGDFVGAYRPRDW